MAANLISSLGTVAAEVALSLLVYADTHSPLYAAASISAGFVPQALSGALLAALADRFPPRATLVGANLISAVLAGCLALPGAPLPVLLAAAAALGAIVPLYNGVRSATLAELLTPAAFVSARSLMRAISRSALVLGFLCGGTLAAAAGPRAVLAGNAGSFLIAAALLRWKTAETAGSRAATGGFRPVMTASLRSAREALGNRRVLIIALGFWLPAAFASAGSGLAVGYAGQAGGGVAAGLLFAAFAAGSTCAELAGARFSIASRQRAVPALMLLTQVPLVGFLAAPPIVVAVLLRLCSGAGMAYLQGLDADLLSFLGPEERRRTMVVVSAGLMAGQGVAMAGAGALAQIAAPGRVIGGAGAVGSVVCLVLAVAHRRAAVAPPGGLPGRTKLERSMADDPART